MQLSEIARIYPGHPFRGKIEEFEDSGVLVVQMRDVSPQGRINWSSCIQTALPGRKSPKYLSVGDILVAARGSHNYAVEVVEEDDFPYETEIVVAPQFYVLSPKYGAINTSFLSWQLNQAHCQRYFQQNAEGTLTKSIRRNILESTPIAVPDMAIQTAIANLARAIRQEQQVMSEILDKNQTLMDAIGGDLLNKAQRTA